MRDRYDGAPLDLLRQREEELLSEMAPLVCSTLEELSQLPHLFYFCKAKQTKRGRFRMGTDAYGAQEWYNKGQALME